MLEKKKPLYRKVNTKARGVYHLFGEKNSNERNQKKIKDKKHESMHGVHQRGLDYSPLFMFLLSKVGKDWNDIFSEAKERLDKTDPIFWLVAKSDIDKKDIVRLGESSYYSGLFIDDSNILQICNPYIKNEDLQPLCSCCTYTFNGEIFLNKYDSNIDSRLMSQKNIVSTDM